MSSLISAKHLGKFSEYLAATFLTFKAYKILHVNYKNKTGEVDIIASKGKKLVFIEVKARRNLDLSYNIVRNRQMQRIKNTAAFYLQKHPNYRNYAVRFDLIMISNLFHITHIKNAWQ